jgi:trehalose-phosphatase
MQHFFSKWKDLEPVLTESTILLFLDYDGTLSPIAAHPKLARLNVEMKLTLEELVLIPEIKVIIISGRMLEELKEFVGVHGLIYVGNHGFELEGPSERHLYPGATEAEKTLKEIFHQLEHVFSPFPGIFVENKIFTLSVHYRALAEDKVPLAQRIYSEVLRPYKDSAQVFLTEGKKVWEVRPGIQWNKGTTLLWLLGRIAGRHSEKVLPIYVGDDNTDEDAFKVVRGKGIGIKVVEKKGETTAADYFLKSPDEVMELLKLLKSIKLSKKIKAPASNLV